MDWINVSLTSLSMAVDAMTVGALDGIHEKKMKIWKVFFIALVFGTMQMAMPIVGYFIGYSFRDVLEGYIPWIAFSLLTILSLKSLYDFVSEKLDKKAKDEEKKEKEIRIPEILLQGVATSIDALCIGFVYLGLEIPQAMLVFGIIGIVTFLLSFVTTFFGSKVADKLERWASLISCLVFFAVGLKILLQGIL